MRKFLVPVVALWLLLPFRSGAWAQENLETPAPINPVSVGEEQSSEDLEEALQVLNEAGVPPTREEWARFLETQAKDDGGRDSSGGFFSARGSIRVRMGQYQHEGLDKYGQARLEMRWLRLRARVREYRSGLKETAGTLAIGGETLELRLGALGLAHGYGMLMAAPGRGSSLAADGGFAPGRERMVAWVGTPDQRTRKGIGARVRWGNWICRTLKEVASISGSPGRGLNAVQVGHGGKDWNLSVAGLALGGQRGGSLAGTISTGPVGLGFETLIWQTNPSVSLAGGAVVYAGWKMDRRTGVELQMGFSDLPGAPPLAGRPAVLPGWAGRGFALRAFTRLDSGLLLRGLIHQGGHWDPTGSRSRHEKDLMEIQAGKRLAPWLELSFRLRRTSRRDRDWSERYPWQPAVESGAENRTISSAQLAMERPRWRARVLLRSYSLDREVGGGRRSLAGLSGRRTLGRIWNLRASWISAWGQPVDLVSAVSPLSGMVLPRHWGHWRSESVIGLECRRGSGRLQAAASLRYPETENGLHPLLTLWAEAEINW